MRIKLFHTTLKSAAHFCHFNSDLKIIYDFNSATKITYVRSILLLWIWNWQDHSLCLFSSEYKPFRWPDTAKRWEERIELVGEMKWYAYITRHFRSWKWSASECENDFKIHVCKSKNQPLSFKFWLLAWHVPVKSVIKSILFIKFLIETRFDGNVACKLNHINDKLELKCVMNYCKMCCLTVFVFD